MALKNLRVVYNNLADLPTTTISASSAQATTPVTNLTKDQKGLVWRSSINTAAATTSTAYLLVSLAASTSVNSLILPYTNLSSAAVISVTAYAAVPTFGGTVAAPTVVGTAGTTTGNVSCCLWNTLALSAWGTDPIASNTYAYGGGTCATVWFPTAITSRYFVVKIVDTFTSKTNSYIEASRLILGTYWSPKYNTGYGMSTTQVDLSTHDRTESGDLVTQRGPRFNKLNFDLGFLEQADRRELTKIMLGNGLPKPIFVSLFPANGTTAAQLEMERAHQIYGKFMSLPGVSYSMLDTYATQIELEEV